MSLVCVGKQNATNTADFLDKIKDCAVAAGWTLHDDRSAETIPAYILSSAGEDGDEMTVYMEFYGNNANRVFSKMWSYWDATGHVGDYYAGSASYADIAADDDGSFDVFISANKDSIVAASFVSSKWNALAVGLIDPYTDISNGELQSSVTAGSSKVLTLAAGEAETFKVGGNYQIVGKTYRQWVEVSAVDSGSNQITLTTLSYAMEAGARIGNTPHRWFHFNTEMQYCFRFKYSTNGSGDDTSQVTTTNYSLMYSTNTDPNPRGGADDMYVLWPYEFSDNTALGGICKESFLLDRTDINTTANEHTLTVNEHDDGTSSGSNTSTTLEDSTQSWTTDEFADKAVVIIAGTGAGQMRAIASNTATALTISDAWTATPDATSEYAIADEVWVYFYFNNNANYAGAVRGV